MFKNTYLSKEMKAVPFFARFLEAQSDDPADDAPADKDSGFPPFPWTLKFPSDWEDS